MRVDDSYGLGAQRETNGPFDTVRAVFWIAVLVVWFIALAPVQFIAVTFKLRIGHLIPVLTHRLILRALGAHVTVRGEPTTSRPVLFVPNHVSWTDIMVLGSLGPASFVAKAEVASWPVFGLLAKLQRSIFVDRDRRHATGRTAAEMVERMREGEPVVLFAEGTSSDGNRVLRFRAALVGAAENLAQATGEIVWIQPIALAYKRLNGFPSGRQHRPRIAWVGDTDLLPHAWQLLKDGAVDIEVIYGAPVPFDPAGQRKAIARYLEERVRTLHAAALTGREAGLPPVAQPF